MTTRTIFFDPTGLYLSYDSDGKLHIYDLNPEFMSSWRISHWELFKIGLRCLWASMR